MNLYSVEQMLIVSTIKKQYVWIQTAERTKNFELDGLLGTWGLFEVISSIWEQISERKTFFL